MNRPLGQATPTVEELEQENEELEERITKLEAELTTSRKEWNSLLETMEARLDAVAKAGWRSCIDHIIKPDSPCPVCLIEQLQARLDALETWAFQFPEDFKKRTAYPLEQKDG